MKVGAENKKKMTAMVVLLAIAIPSVFFSFRSMNQPPAAASASQPSAPAATRAKQKKAGIPQVRENTLDPTLRNDILIASQKIEYKGGARNIFRMEEPPPIKIVAPLAPVVTTPGPPPPPPRTPVNLKFYGFSARPGEPMKAFLSEGDEVFIAKEGDIVNRRYKVVRITRTFVLLEDVLENFQQSVPLTASPAAG